MPERVGMRANGRSPGGQRPSFRGGVVPTSQGGKSHSGTNAGWTLKGIPQETVELTRKAARARGMRIGSWVAESLSRAATRDLEEDTISNEGRILQRLEQIEKKFEAELRAVSNQNNNLDQEIALIRRGLLPKLIETK